MFWVVLDLDDSFYESKQMVCQILFHEMNNLCAEAVVLWRLKQRSRCLDRISVLQMHFLKVG